MGILLTVLAVYLFIAFFVFVLGMALRMSYARSEFFRDEYIVGKILMRHAIIFPYALHEVLRYLEEDRK